MKNRLLITVLLGGIYGLHAAGVKTGGERLRELVVIPTVNMTSLHNLHASREKFLEDFLVPDEIERLRKQAKAEPDNAQCRLRLAELLHDQAETNDSQALILKAAQIARAKSEVRPHDGLTLVFLGEALSYLGSNVEAEAVFRKATIVSSNEWKCRVDLGSFLLGRSFVELLPKNDLNRTIGSTEALAFSVSGFRPTPEDLARAESQRKEAEKCYERAVAIAPAEPDVYLERASIQMNFGIVDALLKFYRGGTLPDDKQFAMINFYGSVIPDIKQAVRLSPDDYRLIGTAAFYEFMSARAKAAQENRAGEDTSKLLSESSQAFLHQQMAHLQTLSEGRDKEQASGAAEVLGFLKMMMSHDFYGAKRDAQRAVSLEPQRKNAWNILMGTALQSGAPPDELVTLAESRLKADDSAFSRALLGKALLRAGRIPEAKDELNEAARMEPDNVLPVLMSAALAIKQSSDEDSLNDAGEQMKKAGLMVGKMPDDENKMARWREWTLDAAILWALMDLPDKARDACKNVLSHFDGDQTAKDILSAMQ